MITDDERVFMAGLLSGMAVAVGQIAAGKLGHVRNLLDDAQTIGQTSPPDDLDRALWQRLGQYPPARGVLRAILGGTGGDRAISDASLKPDPDAVANVWDPLRQALRELEHLDELISRPPEVHTEAR